jgi:hypothetical protein
MLQDRNGNHIWDSENALVKGRLEARSVEAIGWKFPKPEPAHPGKRGAGPGKPAFAPSPGLPPEGLLPIAWPFRGGGAPHARKDATGLTEASARWANRPLAPSSGGNGMPRLACGLATRTHRVRPSEKTALRTVSRAFPARPPAPWPPPEGRAPHARKEDPKRSSCTPIKPPAPRLTTGGNESPCYADGLATRAHRVRPSEKTAPTVIPWFAPLGRPSSDSPPRGGAGSARPQKMARA